MSDVQISIRADNSSRQLGECVLMLGALMWVKPPDLTLIKVPTDAFCTACDLCMLTDDGEWFRWAIAAHQRNLRWMIEHNGRAPTLLFQIEDAVCCSIPAAYLTAIKRMDLLLS